MTFLIGLLIIPSHPFHVVKPSAMPVQVVCVIDTLSSLSVTRDDWA